MSPDHHLADRADPVGAAIRELAAALDEFRRSVTAGDLEELLLRTGALEAAAAHLWNVAAREGAAGASADDTPTGSRASSDTVQEAPSMGVVAPGPSVEIRRLREANAQTRQLLLRALELTRQRHWQVQRVLGIDGAYAINRRAIRFLG